MSLDAPNAQTVDQPIIIRNSKRKLLLVSLLCLVSMLGSLLMVVSSSHDSKNFYAGLFGLSFFGLSLLIFLAQMFTSPIILMIDSEGIHSFYPFWRPLTIKWHEISSIYPIKLRFSTIFVVNVSSKMKPYYVARNYKSGKVPFTLRDAHSSGAVINIPLSTATLSYAKISGLIRQHYAAQIKQYRIYL